MARAGKRKTARISHRHSSRNSTKNSVEDEEETIHEEDDAESTKVADTESTKVADAADSETRPRVDGNSSPGSISLTESIRALGDMSFNSPDYAGEVYSGGKFVTDPFLRGDEHAAVKKSVRRRIGLVAAKDGGFVRGYESSVTNVTEKMINEPGKYSRKYSQKHTESRADGVVVVCPVCLNECSNGIAWNRGLQDGIHGICIPVQIALQAAKKRLLHESRKNEPKKPNKKKSVKRTFNCILKRLCVFSKSNNLDGYVILYDNRSNPLDPLSTRYGGPCGDLSLTTADWKSIAALQCRVGASVVSDDISSLKRQISSCSTLADVHSAVSNHVQNVLRARNASTMTTDSSPPPPPTSTTMTAMTTNPSPPPTSTTTTDSSPPPTTTTTATNSGPPPTSTTTTTTNSNPPPTTTANSMDALITGGGQSRRNRRKSLTKRKKKKRRKNRDML